MYFFRLSETENGDFEKMILLKVLMMMAISTIHGMDCDEDYKYNLDFPNASGFHLLLALPKAIPFLFSRGYKG